MSVIEAMLSFSHVTSVQEYGCIVLTNITADGAYCPVYQFNMGLFYFFVKFLFIIKINEPVYDKRGLLT